MKNGKQPAYESVIFYALTCLFAIGTLFPRSDITNSCSSDGYILPSEDVHNSAYRSVLQIIDNTIYHWLEYENPDSGSFFIYKIYPEKAPLNANDASLHLARSRQWEKYFSQITYNTSEDVDNSDGETVDPDTTAVSIELPSTAFIFSNESNTPRERMIDNRIILSGEKATTYPYNVAGFLSINFPLTDDYDMRATAFVVGPHTIITNAHCLYANDNGGLFDSAKFYRARYEQNSEIVDPYQTILPVTHEIDKRFMYYEDLYYETEDNTYRIEAVRHDLAALFTEHPINDISTFVPLEFNLTSNPSNISLPGYPGVVRDTETKGMWLSEGDIVSSDDNILKYEAYTSGGNSGSPILYHNQEADTYRIIAIHSFTPEDLSYSGGPYFNDSNIEMVKGWLLYTPEESEHKNDTDTEPDETAETDPPMLGDVNGDGKINVTDVVLTMRHALELSLLSGDAMMRADVNGDGVINVLDVTLIMRFSLGLIDTF